MLRELQEQSGMICMHGKHQGNCSQRRLKRSVIGAGALLKHNAAKHSLNVDLPSLRDAADRVQLGTDELKKRAKNS